MLARAQDTIAGGRPITLLVSYPAGGGADLMARLLAPAMGQALGQPVVVDNKPGAGTLIGAELVAKSPPDGYTLMVHSSGHAVNASMYPTLPYDTTKDFVEVATLGAQPNVLVVAPASGLRTVADLIAAAKKSPGALNYGSAGIGSGTHVNAEKFKLAAGIDAVHIPYKGTPEAITDTMTGRVTYFFSPISAALPNIREGKLVALGVSTAKRSSALPNVPTIAESGLPGFDYNLWVGLWAPAGTPQDIVDKINADVAKVLAMPDVRERLAALGAEPMVMTPADFRKFMREEVDDAAKVVKAAGIKAQ
jgi:tripartite-type tricarboxylate transporter receptor subunit TctC